MELQYSELDGHVRSIKLSGALDISGAGQIETRFAGYCSGENALVLVDVSQVSFLASIGIRLFTLNAKSVASRGGRMVLVGPTPEVKSVLAVTGIINVIPIHDSVESALAALSS